MFLYPDINPVALQIGPVKIHWYGLMYVLGFLSAYLLGTYRARQAGSSWTAEQVSDAIFYGAIGVILGGRIGFMLFYNLPQLLSNPISLIKVWDGGMSFHGGLLGVLVAMFLFARHINKPFLAVTDFIAPLVPLGLAFGRIGNFINGELWGRVTSMPWGVIFPHVDNQARHPSQLYEFLLEGILLFIILWIYSVKPRGLGSVSGLFLLMYGLLRCVAELFRIPDPQYGYLALGWVTMGQILSLPMIVLGLFLVRRAMQQRVNPPQQAQ